MKNFELKSSLATIGILFMALLLLGSCNKKEAPAAPTNLKAELNGDCIHLSWKRVQNAAYYRITVGFQIRDQNNCLLDETYEVFLCETSDHTYNDRYPFDGMNYYKIEAVNEYGSSPCSEVSCYYANYANTGCVALYPNPTKGNVTIEAAGMSRIIVTNLLGEVCFEWEVDADEFVLNMSQFNSSIYLIRIHTENGEVVKRAVVMNE